jgi:hypothetical protein
MKKNIEVLTGEKLGQYVVKKKRGKFTLEEILEALKKYDEDIYYIIFDARDDNYQCTGAPENKGDVIEAWKLFALIDSK